MATSRFNRESRAVNLTHAAGADGGNDLVAAQPASGGQEGWLRSHGFHLGVVETPGWAFEQILAGVSHEGSMLSRFYTAKAAPPTARQLRLSLGQHPNSSPPPFH